MLVAQSCLTLCDPMDCSPSGSSVHGDSAGKNTGVGNPLPSPGNLRYPGVEPGSPALQADSLPSESPGKPGFSYIWLVISVGVGRVRGPSLSPSTFSNYKTGRKEDSWGLGPANFSIPLLPGEAGTML